MQKSKMELVSCSKNIWADYDDNEKEELLNKDEEIWEEDEVSGETNFEFDENDQNIEGEDEPDFMDNSGQLWAFASQIRNGQHLKEWCLQNGELLPGKEENLTQQFDCPVKNCEFKAIFLKIVGIVYSRNEHNHPMESNSQKKQAKMIKSFDEQDYVDHLGKLWHFCARIGKNNILPDKFQKEFGFTKVVKKKKEPNKFYLSCRRRRPAGGECRFAGIYLIENGCLYTRNAHEHHEKNRKLPLKIGVDYVDHLGKLWPFHSKIGKDVQQELFRTQFGFSIIQQKQTTLNLYCSRKEPNGGKCEYSGIYLRENGCLYIRGKHEHSEKKGPPKVGDDYVDHLGKLWKFNVHLGKGMPRDIFRKEFGYTHITSKIASTTMNLYCHMNGPGGGRCKFAGVYLKENGCLYTRGQHEHEE